MVETIRNAAQVIDAGDSNAALTQLKAWLAREGFGENDRLPPEQALCQKLGVTQTRERDDMKSLAISAIAALVANSAIAADDHPSRPITILVPFAPGGVVDLASRTIGEGLSKMRGQEVIVENRAGGSGFIAASAAAQADADG